MNYWLLKTEPGCYSIDDLAKDNKTSWGGIRNYQARNFIRDSMKVGDMVLFYHSSVTPPVVAGIAKVTGAAHPDPTQFDKKDEHYDPKATREKPLWYAVEISFVEKFENPITLDQIKFDPKLAGIMVAARGSRLSVQPVSAAHYAHIMKHR